MGIANTWTGVRNLEIYYISFIKFFWVFWVPSFYAHCKLLTEEPPWFFCGLAQAKRGQLDSEVRIKDGFRTLDPLGQGLKGKFSTHRNHGILIHFGYFFSQTSDLFSGQKGNQVPGCCRKWAWHAAAFRSRGMFVCCLWHFYSQVGRPIEVCKASVDATESCDKIEHNRRHPKLCQKQKLPQEGHWVMIQVMSA